MTTEQCPQCNTTVSVEVLGAYLKCESCGMLIPMPRKKRGSWAAHNDDGGVLGIHPALARRYQKPTDEVAPGAPGELTTDDVDAPVPSVQLSPSLVEEALQKRAGTPAHKGPGGEKRAEKRGAKAEKKRAPVDEPEEERTAIESKPGAFSSASPSSLAPDNDDNGNDGNGNDTGRRQRDSTRPLRPSFEKPSTARPNDTPLQRPATRAPRPKEPMPELPALEMLEQVGKGAMGRVFKARDEKTDHIVAVKLLAPELAARPDFVARFEREAAALKRVDHPGVVATRGSGSYKEHHYLVMEYVDGVSLRRILDGGPLTPGRALHFARQITQGLGAAHAKSVIHRDLKPENILVERITGDDGEEDERLVLVDFGLAGIIEEAEDPHPNLTKSRMTMGTVNYMAPEQRTDAKRVDQRADLYAGGVILYELLTGDLPLGRFALPRERGLPLPESVDDCIHKALARNPDERFQTATDLDQALARIQSELSRAASMDTLVGRSMVMDSEAEYEEEEDSLSEQLPGSVRSVLARVPADEMSTASGKNAEWHTAPPWVKRPELLWGVLALAIGAGAALLLADGEEVAAVPTGPALLVEESDVGARISLSSAGPTEWSSPVDGWSAAGAVVRFEGETLSPADPSLHVYPESLLSADVIARVVVDVQSLSPEGQEEPPSYGGVMVKTAQGTAVGVMRFTDGKCGVLELDDEAARVSPFRCPTTAGPMEVGLRCSRQGGKCLVDAGGAAEAEYEFSLGEGALSFALACAGRSCSFANPEAPKPNAP